MLTFFALKCNIALFWIEENYQFFSLFNDERKQRTIISYISSYKAKKLSIVSCTKSHTIILDQTPQNLG
jgi:hypothetical protein